MISIKPKYAHLSMDLMMMRYRDVQLLIKLILRVGIIPSIGKRALEQAIKDSYTHFTSGTGRKQ
jgi:hypothetical protein